MASPPRFHTNCALGDNLELQLEEGPSAHISRALRMRCGDALTLFDGGGGEYPAHITAVDKRHVRVRTGALHPREVESALQLHLGIAMSRGDRMDQVVQKATELGVSRITPLSTARSEVKLQGERAARKVQHWQRIAISACEQSGRNRLPGIGAVSGLGNWLDGIDSELRLVLHHHAKPLEEAVRDPASVALLIGPEGGLDETEIDRAERAGFLPLALGPRVLRTETAPLVAITLVQSCWGDMPLPL